MQFLDYDTVVEINAVATGGGVLDPGGIEANLGRAEATYGGVELYPRIWDKAAALLHSFATTQYFADGNKRTGYLVAETFLQLNGHQIPPAPPVQAEAFVQSVSADRLTLAAIAEWFEVQHQARRPGYASDQRVEYLMLAMEADVSIDGLISLVNGGISTISTSQLPIPLPITVVGRVHWREQDADGAHDLYISIIPPELDEAPDDGIFSAPFHQPARGGHLHHEAGLMPAIFAIPVVVYATVPGVFSIRVHLDGALVGTIPFEVAHVDPRFSVAIP